MQQPWAVVQPKGNSQFLLSLLECRQQPRAGLREHRPEQLTDGQTCPRKIPAVTTSALITAPRFKVPAHSDPVKRWNFRKADWKRFCPLTGESVERSPPPDTPDIERAYQDFCESLLSAAKQCIIPRGRRKNYVPCWDKDCETLYHSLSEPQWGLPLTEPPRPYSLDYNR